MAGLAGDTVDLVERLANLKLGSFGEESGLHELLSLLVESVQGLAEEFDGHQAKLVRAVTSCEEMEAAAADSAAAAARDSAAAAIAMAEACKATPREPSISAPTTPAGEAKHEPAAPEPPGASEIGAEVATVPSEPVASAASVPDPTDTVGGAAPPPDDAIAEQMSAILERAHLAASELIELVDDAPAVLRRTP
jgi:hypothetical protein